MLTLKLVLCVAFLGLVAGTVVRHDFAAARPRHRLRHRHEYYKHIREYLRRRRERLAMKVHVTNKDLKEATSTVGTVGSEARPGIKVHVANTEPKVVRPTTTTTTTTTAPIFEATTSSKKSIQKLRHFFYPKESMNRKIDEIRETERKLAKLREVTTTPMTEVEPTQPTSTPEVHRFPDPDVVLRGLGRSEAEIERFHRLKDVDFLHHLKNGTPPSINNRQSNIRDKQIAPKPRIESIEKLQKEFRYDGESSLPILDRPMFEVPPLTGSDFKPVKMPSGFRHYDIDKDGFVSKDELVLITGAEENVDYIFKLADTDGDGLLNRREFHRAPWRLQGDPKHNAGIEKIAHDVQRELARKARQLHLEYIPRVTVKQEPTRVKQEKEGREEDDIRAMDTGRHPDPLGLWYADDENES